MLQTIELLAVISAATYGILLARRSGMDFVGVFSVALIVAFGGGTLRDLFLDRVPLFWIKNHHYPVIVFVLALGLSMIPRFPRRVERILFVPDALGLGLFTVAGAAAGLEAETSWFIAALLGVVTGTFGGVIGDVVCHRPPSLFQPTTPLYATCSFVGAWGYILMLHFGAPDALAAPIGIAAIVALRIAALHWDWKLPDLSHAEDNVG